MKILILGVTGMLGHALFYYFSKNKQYDVYATIRGTKSLNKYFPTMMLQKVVSDVNADYINKIQKTIEVIDPDVVINCIGIIKQLKEAKESIISIKINSLFPHQLAEICIKTNCRMIHISTDCVFSGKDGNYKEEDIADEDDLYGRTKYLGEVDYPNAITLRTSIIGHELKNKISLIDWFLSQKNSVNGFRKAIYTGFPTIEFAEIIDKYVLTNNDLKGLYHVSTEPISKYELLNLIAEIYHKDIQINPDDSFIINRSLESNRFKKVTGYSPPAWKDLIIKMHNDYLERKDIYQQNKLS